MPMQEPIAPTWQRGDVSLYLGDCREILPTLGKVDAVVTDPPYGVEFAGKATKDKAANGEGYIGKDCASIGPLIIQMCLDSGWRAVVFSGNANAFTYPRPRDIGGVFCSNGVGLGRWGFTCFHIILFYGSPPHGCTLPTGFSYSSHRPDLLAAGHPCPKPTYWMEWATKIGSDRDQTILDPFMGSGTTGVAAVKLGRKFIGIEIEPKYFEIALRRINEAIDATALFETVPPAVKQADLFGKDHDA